MTIITLVKGEQRQEITRGFHYESSEGLEFIQFCPPIKKGRAEVEYLYTDVFDMETKSSIKILPQSYKLTIPKNVDALEIRFITPKPIPIPNILNINISNTNYHQTVFLFDSEGLEYIGIVDGKWFELEERIKAFLELKGKACRNVRVGSLSKADHNYETIESFFGNPPSSDYKFAFLTLVVDADNDDAYKISGQIISLKGVPTLPKAIAIAGSDILLSNELSGEALATWRRLTYSAVNCGVVLPMLELIEPDDLNGLQLRDFDIVPSELNLAETKASSSSVMNSFSTELNRFIHFVHADSNEATWCGNFWFPVITQCFDLAGMPVNYDIQLELETKDYLHPKTGSKIDLAATINLGTRILPILFVEAGKETVPEGYLHKDSSKIQSLLSLGSYTMAYELINIHKNPELAFTFGILIGGYGCQLLIGRPVLRELENGTFEIYVNITYHDHWKFDIFDGPNTFPGCRDSCCYLNLDVSSISENSDVSSSSENSRVADDTEDLTNDTLKCLQEFIKLVKRRIDLILSNDHLSRDQPGRIYAPKRDQASISFARSSSYQDTPSFNRPAPTRNIRKHSSSGPDSSPLAHKQRKRSPFEASVYSECAAYYGSVFPRIYNLDRVETEYGPRFDYTFEFLIPFVHPEGIISTEYFNIYEPYEFIAQCIRFTIHCMYGLHILHEKLKIVHGDLKPSNIMYSKVDNSWKIIDFDHSAPIQESSQIERKAGTNGFWAPECQNGTGIFTPASDIFAFGKIIEDVFFLFLMGIACAEPVQRDLEKGCFVITRLMHQMRKTAAKDRPTALEALKIAIEGLNEFDSKGMFKDHVIESASLIESDISKTTAVHETSVQTLKRSKIDSEKDVIKLSVPNLVQ
jgi:hypothetical protein